MVVNFIYFWICGEYLRHFVQIQSQRPNISYSIIYTIMTSWKPPALTRSLIYFSSLYFHNLWILFLSLEVYRMLFFNYLITPTSRLNLFILMYTHSKILWWVISDKNSKWIGKWKLKLLIFKIWLFAKLTTF